MRKLLLPCIFLFFFWSCSISNHKENLASYMDYKNDQRIADLIDDIENCDTKLELASQLKTIDFIRKKSNVFDVCGGLSINIEVEKADANVINRLEKIFEQDQKIRYQIRDSLKDNYTMERLLYFINNYELKQDTISYQSFKQIIDSIGEWPGVNYIPRKPNYPKTEVLVGHFPEKEFVKSVKMVINAAHQNKEYWGKAKMLVEYSMVKPIPFFLEKGGYVYPFRFMEFQKNGEINEASELTILDLENITNPQFVNEGCDRKKYHFVSTVEDDGHRQKLLKRVEQILLENGLSKDEIEFGFKKQEPYFDYKIYFQKICI